MERYFDTPTLSDVTVHFGKRKIQAHKVILGGSSRWFQKAFEGPFKEASSDTIHLHDDDPEIIELLLKHCYGFDTQKTLTETVSSEDTPDMILTGLINVYVAADKYMVPTLLDLVSDEFRKNAANTWKSLFQEDRDFESLITTIYNTLVAPSNDIRKIAALETAKNIVKFRRENEALVRKILEDNPDFAIDLVFAMGPPLTLRNPSQSRSGSYPLHRAAELGNLTQVQALLATRGLGAGVDGVDEQDSNGETPLHFATWAGHLAITQVLIEQGEADINAKGWTYGKTPLYWARQANHQAIVNYLVQQGASDD